jgi:hypothetical protein
MMYSLVSRRSLMNLCVMRIFLRREREHVFGEGQRCERADLPLKARHIRAHDNASRIHVM